MVEKTAPIIVKRIKKGGHGHHGGSWKVAYADFVTAMMAFFLLLWLISATTQEQRSGLADYFTPTQGITGAVGIGTKGGITVTDEGVRRDNKNNPGIVIGGMPNGPTTDVLDKKSLIESNADANLFENTMDKIKKNIESDPDLTTFKENIDAKVTPDGLKIDITDSDKYGMYETNSGKLTPFGETVLKKMGNLVKTLPNHITITGHTAAGKIEKSAGITNWELSTDRANSARRFLMGQLEAERVSRVIGAADKDLLVPSSPTSSKNRRITILLLRGSYMEGQGPNENIREMLTVPTPVDTSKLDDSGKKSAAAPAAVATPAAPASTPASAPLAPPVAPPAPVEKPAPEPAVAPSAAALPMPAMVTQPQPSAAPGAKAPGGQNGQTLSPRISSLPGMSNAGASDHNGDE